MCSKMPLFGLILVFNMHSVLAQEKPLYYNEDSAITATMKMHKVPVVGIGIIRNGQLTQVKVFGELKKDTIAPYNTIFNVASLTKPVVSMLTLKLVSEGKWNLDEPLYKFWTDPDVINDPRSKLLNTRHVLSHTTGFVNWRWLHPTKKLTFDFDPGTKLQYSGEGFNYLQKALEKKFHTPLDRLVDSLIFRPLKMWDSKLIWDETVDEKRFAPWYEKDGKASHNITKQTKANAADDMLTTIEDYGNFCVAVMNNSLFPITTFNEMINAPVKIKEKDFMGLGWEILTEFSNNQYALVHSGSDRGVKTLAILIPGTKEGIIIMTNGDNGMMMYDGIIGRNLSLGIELMKRE